jgi:hypothetical protein
MQVFVGVDLSILGAARVLVDRYPGRWTNAASMPKRGLTLHADSSPRRP